MALTKYPSGSLKELMAISFPLMLNSLSWLFMILVDRLFLARYSLAALNAAAVAGMLAYAFTLAPYVITSMSEAFVAQYFGAKRYAYLGRPIWQMLWFSLLSSLLFFPLAIFGTPLLTQGALESTYFSYLLYFGPFVAAGGALCSFFIGQGKILLVTVIIVSANIINMILDYVLIFGIEGFIPSMGIKGAAIATNVGEVLQIVILLGVFLNKTNRERFFTHRIRLHFPLFLRIIRVAAPLAVFTMMELIGWSTFYKLMRNASIVHITISSICQTLIFGLWFVGEGVGKAATAICGNLIGEKNHEMVPKVIKTGLKIFAPFFVLSLIGLLLFPQSFVALFFSAENMMIPTTLENITFCLILSLIYIFFAWVRLLFNGVLTAAGDTRFLLYTGAFSVWCFVVIPIYFLLNHFNISVETAWMIGAVYGLILTLIYSYRFKKGYWKKVLLID
ncbi:MAG: hypothetical protein K940chlam8_00070 [Chlamydiae bacterium]|nr:hypothetical protein [Chlamydiota bacterium]